MSLIWTLALLAPTAALAHATTLPVPPQTLWQAWSFEPWVVIPLFAVHWLYGRGLSLLWGSAGRGRGISIAQAGCFLAGEAALFVALMSPLDALGSTLQAAHMTQHMLLIAVAPPLLLLGRPEAAFGWALGARGGRALARMRTELAWLAAPVVAAALHAAAIWAWHIPSLYHAALENDFVHWLEHIAFLSTGMLLWSVLLRGVKRPSHAPAAMAAGLATLLHSGFLAALFTFSPVLFYPWYDGRAQLWDLTPLTDQQLAGLIMWVPGMPVYLAVILLAARNLIESGTRTPAAESFGTPIHSRR